MDQVMNYLNVDNLPPKKRRYRHDKNLINPGTDYVGPCKSPSIILIKNVITVKKGVTNFKQEAYCEENTAAKPFIFNNNLP